MRVDSGEELILLRVLELIYRGGSRRGGGSSGVRTPLG